MIRKARTQTKLSPLQRRVMRALLARVAPSGDGGNPNPGLEVPGAAEEAAAYAERFMMGGPPEFKLALRFWVWTFEYLTFLMVFTWGRFTRQRPEVQDLTIRRYQKSRFYFKRGMLKVLVSFCFISFYSRLAVRARLGYDLERVIGRPIATDAATAGGGRGGAGAAA